MTTTFATERNADSHNTSIEIMQAIAELSRNDAEAERIWDDPTPDELLTIWEIVTNNGLKEASDYWWGVSGDRWADNV